MNGKRAWVTLALTDDYAIAALVLAKSLKDSGSKIDLHIIITENISEPIRKIVIDVFDDVTIIDPSKHQFNSRADLASVFVKLSCWRLTKYSKCVFLDAACLVIKNCDELFEYPELSAAPDVRWPDLFSSGVYVFVPNNETYSKLVDHAIKYGTFDGGDQGVLNDFFTNWKSSLGTRLPFVYNTTSNASYTYISAFKRFQEEIKLIHFAGNVKPWHYKYNVLSGNLTNTRGGYFNIEHVRMWWNIFVQHVMSNLFQQESISRQKVEPVLQEPIKYYYEPSNLVSDDAVDQCEKKPEINHYEPWSAVHYYQAMTPPPPTVVTTTFPFVASVTYNIEPAGYTFHHQNQPFQQKQDSSWSAGQLPYSEPQQPVSSEIGQEQPWKPPELPNFIGAELPAVDRTTFIQPNHQIWPPLLAEVTRMLPADDSSFNAEHVLRVLKEVAEKVPNDYLNRPLDNSLIFPSKVFGRRLANCPLCNESLSYLDEYFPIEDTEYEEKPLQPLQMGSSVAEEVSKTVDDVFDHEDYEHKLAWEHGAIDYKGRDSWDKIMQHLLKRM